MKKFFLRVLYLNFRTQSFWRCFKIFPILTLNAMQSAAAASHQIILNDPVVIGANVTTSSNVNLNAPSTLLTKIIEIRPVINPVLDVLAKKAGLERISARSFKGAIKTLEPSALERFFRAIPSKMLVSNLTVKKYASFNEIKRPTAIKDLKNVLSSKTELQNLVSLPFSSKGPTRTGVFAVISVGTYLRIDFVTEGFGTDLMCDLNMFKSQTVKNLMFTPPVAFSILEDASLKGYPLLDFGRPPKIKELNFLLESSVLFLSKPGYPSETIIRCGTQTNESSSVLTPLQAIRQMGRLNLTVPVASEDKVVELAEMDLAASANRPGLREHQDHFVSLYAASETGAICALDTGMGKTVTAASAIKHESSKVSNYRALITCPKGVKNQWVQELNKWAPSVKVHVLNSFKDFDVLTKETTEPVAFLLSHELLTRNVDAFLTSKFNDFVIDEVRVASKTSSKTKAFEKVRKVCVKAMALTATPAERNLSEVAYLAALIRDDETLTFDVDELYSPSRLGPIFFQRDASYESDSLPKVNFETFKLTMSSQEEDLVNEIMKEIQKRKELLLNARKSKDTSKVNALRSSLVSSINLLRSSLSDASNLFRSESSFAQALVAKGLVSQAASQNVKRLKLVEEVKSWSFSHQTLICTDFVGSCETFVNQATSAGLKAAALTGSQSSVERAMICASFDAGDLDVLTLSSSAQRGINLQTASKLIHLDLPLTSTAALQRSGRIVRLGSNHEEVNVYSSYYENTLEEIIFKELEDVFKNLDPSKAKVKPVSLLTDELSIVNFAEKLDLLS